MHMPPRPSFADADVNLPFQHSALKSTAQHDRLFHLFRMRWVADEASVGRRCGRKVWEESVRQGRCSAHMGVWDTKSCSLIPVPHALGGGDASVRRRCGAGCGRETWGKGDAQRI